jgi:hypothetical protein
MQKLFSQGFVGITGFAMFQRCSDLSTKQAQIRREKAKEYKTILNQLWIGQHLEREHCSVSNVWN